MREWWRKTLTYFGLSEDEDYEDYEEEQEEIGVYEEKEPSTVRRIRRGPDLERVERTAALRSVSSPQQSRVHIVEPRNFNDAQRIAEKFKADIPVILNLQQSDKELSKRLIDFVSGLTYGLNGGMQRVAEKVFLLTPSNVGVSAEEKRRLQEKGFFNQF